MSSKTFRAAILCTRATIQLVPMHAACLIQLRETNVRVRTCTRVPVPAWVLRCFNGKRCYATSGSYKTVSFIVLRMTIHGTSTTRMGACYPRRNNDSQNFMWHRLHRARSPCVRHMFAQAWRKEWTRIRCTVHTHEEREPRLLHTAFSSKFGGLR